MPNDTPYVAGCIGKLPLHGDFIRHNALSPELQQFDRWIQQGLHLFQRKIAPPWEHMFDSMPPVRFIYHHTTAAPKKRGQSLFYGRSGGNTSSQQTLSHALLGTLVPSMDKHGRRYPFITFTSYMTTKGQSELSVLYGAFGGFMDSGLEISRNAFASTHAADTFVGKAIRDALLGISNTALHEGPHPVVAEARKNATVMRLAKGGGEDGGDTDVEMPAIMPPPTRRAGPPSIRRSTPVAINSDHPSATYGDMRALIQAVDQMQIYADLERTGRDVASYLSGEQTDDLYTRTFGTPGDPGRGTVFRRLMSMLIESMCTFHPDQVPAFRLPNAPRWEDVAFWFILSSLLNTEVGFPTLALWTYPTERRPAIMTLRFGEPADEDFMPLLWPHIPSERVLNLMDSRSGERKGTTDLRRRISISLDRVLEGPSKPLADLIQRLVASKFS